MQQKFTAKRKFITKIRLGSNTNLPPPKKRRRMNTEEPLSYFFGDICFPAITFPAEACAGNPHKARETINPFKNIIKLHLNNVV